MGLRRLRALVANLPLDSIARLLDADEAEHAAPTHPATSIEDATEMIEAALMRGR